jgi:ethanolamine utilization microcompartment shell protein EutS
MRRYQSQASADHTRNEFPFKISLAALLLSFVMSPPVAAQSYAERWSCADSNKKMQEWVIVENKMFVPKGRGSLTLTLNTSAVAVAHLSLKYGAIWIIVLDKQSGRLTEYNTISAASLHSDQPVEPMIDQWDCRRRLPENSN